MGRRRPCQGTRRAASPPRVRQPDNRGQSGGGQPAEVHQLDRRPRPARPDGYPAPRPRSDAHNGIGVERDAPRLGRRVPPSNDRLARSGRPRAGPEVRRSPLRDLLTARRRSQPGGSRFVEPARGPRPQARTSRKEIELQAVIEAVRAGRVTVQQVSDQLGLTYATATGASTLCSRRAGFPRPPHPAAAVAPPSSSKKLATDPRRSVVPRDDGHQGRRHACANGRGRACLVGQ